MIGGAPGRRPNILIVITDQEREVMHWPEGWAEANLPARNRLLANGLRFTRAQCNTAACSSSRATFFTGLYPAQHGVKNLISCDNPSDVGQRRQPMLPSSLPNLAKVMSEAGYHVVLKGKLHLTRPVNYDPARKRRYWSDADVQHLADKYGFHGWNPPDMSDPTSLSDLGGGSINNDGRYVDGTGTAAGPAASLDDLFRESAVNFINTYDGDKPFCLIVALVNPHDVQEYPGRGVRGASIAPTFERGGYRLEDFQHLPIGLPPNIDDDLATKPSVQASFRQFLAVGTGHVKTVERQLNYARFYAYLNQQVDAQIGKLLDALDARNLTGSTLIVRTSDHGELGMSHGRMRQKFYNVYRETLNVPLIVSNPCLFPRPQTSDALVSLIDVLPTLATIGGVPEPQRFGFKGRDLTPILRDPKASVQDVLHFTYEDDVFPVKGADCIRAIVERDWKYAVYYDPFTGSGIEYEMYDLKNDPLEMKNLAHPSNRTAESEIERVRLHRRLSDVMNENGTVPDEIAWPDVDAYQPSTNNNQRRSTKVNAISTAVKKVITAAVLLLAALITTPAYAQLNGENLLGDMGVKSGTQPEPGFYVGSLYYRYFTDSIKGPDGQSVVFDPSGSGQQTINAGVPLAIYVTKKKLFGANIGMMAVMPFANGALEAPGLGLSEVASTGASNLYVMPMQLGWHFKRAEAIAGVAFFAPTGRHSAGASDNLGKGMWSTEISSGATVYLDRARSISVATTAFWETHTGKEGSVTAGDLTVDDVKVGQLMTLEGGVGKSFLHGAASIGMAYYAQWKLTPDQMTVSASPDPASIDQKHQVWGVGPEVTIPIATKSTLIALVNVRYLWETGARVKTQGQSLLVTSTFPVGGIKISGR
ncbi:MAG TPA: sulfatase-like hydrolase/transferase [Vicinamibacterales bacterium]